MGYRDTSESALTDDACTFPNVDLSAKCRHTSSIRGSCEVRMTTGAHLKRPVAGPSREAFLVYINWNLETRHCRHSETLTSLRRKVGQTAFFPRKKTVYTRATEAHRSGKRRNQTHSPKCTLLALAEHAVQLLNEKLWCCRPEPSHPGLLHARRDL